jgi:mono/diheme cytochrome c family protein
MRITSILTVLLVTVALGLLAAMHTFADEDEEANPAPRRDAITRFVETYGDAERGETLFRTFYEEAGFACATCHRADSEDRLIGPGLLNIGQRGAERIAGRSAVLYIYMTIIRPGFYTVESYPENLMPASFDDIFDEPDLYDLIAYLLTLRDE